MLKPSLKMCLSIDAHKGGKGEEGGTSCTPSKDFQKLDHKNAIKHKNRGPPQRFFQNHEYYPSYKIENDCASNPCVFLTNIPPQSKRVEVS
jgi:hypothetical protein